MLRPLLLLASFLFGFGFAAFSQNSDSKGTDFWLMFNGNVSTPVLTVFITSDVATSGVVSIPGLGFSAPFTVAANSVTPVVVPTAAGTHTSNVVDNKGIHITALQEVTVYGLNYAQFTTDAYLGLPTNVLGTDYIVLTYSGNNLSSLGIVGTVNATTVTITPSVAASGRPAGVPFNITLNQGQTYELGNASDLTGTIITSTSPVGVMGANACANIPPGASFCDHINEMMPPTDTWGRKFGTVPLKSRANGDTWRFLASENATVITINGVAQPAINRGQFIERILTTQSVIESNKRILAAQYANGSGFSGNPGDPFMMLIPPLEQFLAKYTVTTVSGYVAHYINVIAPNSIAGSLTLDGVVVPAASFTPIGTTGFSGAQITVTPGTHNLFGTLPFGVFMYGFTNDDSYGYPGGQSFAPVGIVNSVVLTPETGTAQVGTEQCFDALVKDQFGNTLAGVRVDFGITGANPGSSSFAFTNGSGIAHFCYTGINTGTDNIVASVGTLNDASSFVWTPAVSDVYYSKPSGDLHNVLTWGLNPNGSGPNPSDFNDSIFQLANRPNIYTMTADWTVGGTINIPTASQLQINGSTLSIASLAGSGTLTGSTTSNLVVTGSAGGDAGALRFTGGSNTLNNFTLNRTGATASATLGTALNLLNVLTLSNGTLNTGNLLTLKSTAANTARVAPVTGSISGTVTVERYIPARRAWRLLAAPVGGTSEAANGVSSLTHAQETAQGALTTSTGDPRPLSFGTATFSLNAAHTAMTFTATITNIDVTGTQTADLNDNLTAAHIHVGAPPGVNGPVRWGFFGAPDNDNNPDNLIVTPFATGVGGTFSSTWDLPEGNAGTTLATNLPGILGGLSYINFHTVQFSGGEIRGQINLIGAGTQTINQAWQEGATTFSPNPNPAPGFGTHITQSASNGADGLDFNTAIAMSSLKRHQNSNNTWVPVLNTNATPVNSNAWFTFVRGDRSINMGFNTVAPNNTTLRASGPLRTGDQTFPIAATGLTAIPNPYASPLNFASIATNNPNIANSFTVVDPKLGSTGAFVTVSFNGTSYDVSPTAVSPITELIQSGQGFLVQSTGLAGSITIKESDKSATAATNVFRTAGTPTLSPANAPVYSDPATGVGLRINLQAINDDHTTTLLDEVFSSYKSDYSKEIDQMDAVKMANNDENIGVEREGHTLILERRPLPANGDIIPLKIWNLAKKTYLLEINPVNLAAAGLNAYLEDKYLKTSTPIRLDKASQVFFTITGDVASLATNRFQIILSRKVLSELTIVPGKSSITAFPNPITSRTIALLFTNKPAGNYQVTLRNTLGQVVFTKNIQHGGGTSTQTLQLDKKPVSGVYHLQLSNKEAVTNLSLLSN